MELTEHQLATVLQAVAEVRDPGMGERGSVYQAQLKQETLELIQPLIAALPQGVRAAQLLHYDGLFRRLAIDLMLAKLRQVQIYRGASEMELIAHISQEHVFQVSRQLYLFAVTIIEALPSDPSLEALLDDFEAIDLDAELAELVEGD